MQARKPEGLPHIPGPSRNVPRRGMGRAVHCRAGVAHRASGREVSSISTRLSSATRSPRFSRPSESPIATRCGCSGRQRACTGGAAGRYFSRPRSRNGKPPSFRAALFVEFAANRFIFRRGALRGAAHWLIMWGCILAAAITFPLVWGWIEFRTVSESIRPVPHVCLRLSRHGIPD